MEHASKHYYYLNPLKIDSFLTPLIIVQLIHLEENISAASINTGGSSNLPQSEDETTQEGDLVEWEFN